MAKGKGKAKEKLATDAELFTIDAAGDEGLRRNLLSSTWDAPAAAHARRGSGKPLKSEEILAQRSRVPARTSKIQAGVMTQIKNEREKRSKITPELKKRLRSMVKHSNTQDRGLWDVAPATGSAALQLTENKDRGSYDVWTVGEVTRGSSKDIPEDIKEVVVKSTVKPPAKFHTHQLLGTSSAPRAVALPHPGMSYNPTFDDHQALLAVEHAKAIAEENELEKLGHAKETIMAGQNARLDAWETGFANEVGSGDEDEEDGSEHVTTGNENNAAKKRKLQRRKTEKARKKRQANKLLEAQMRAQSKLTKSQRQALSTLPSVVGSIETSSSISLAQLHKRKTQLASRLASSGLADLRSGPAKVPKPKPSYLLSDELPESLRQLKADGNLWTDWLDSSKRRGRVQTERHLFGRMKKQKGRGLKEIEKVKWRRFEV